MHACVAVSQSSDRWATSGVRALIRCIASPSLACEHLQARRQDRESFGFGSSVRPYRVWHLVLNKDRIRIACEHLQGRGQARQGITWIRICKRAGDKWCSTQLVAQQGLKSRKGLTLSLTCINAQRRLASMSARTKACRYSATSTLRLRVCGICLARLT